MHTPHHHTTPHTVAIPRPAEDPSIMLQASGASAASPLTPMDLAMLGDEGIDRSLDMHDSALTPVGPVHPDEWNGGLMPVVADMPVDSLFERDEPRQQRRQQQQRQQPQQRPQPRRQVAPSQEQAAYVQAVPHQQQQQQQAYAQPAPAPAPGRQASLVWIEGSGSGSGQREVRHFSEHGME